MVNKSFRNYVLNSITFLAVLIISLLPVFGCSNEKPFKTCEYNLNNIEYFDEFYIVKTEYYADKVVIYCDGKIDVGDCYYIFDGISKENIKKEKKKITVITDKPDSINSFSACVAERGETEEYSFRYLDSDEYACLFSWVDIEGGVHVKGDENRFYTSEEINAKNERIAEYEENEKEIFDKLNGFWVDSEGEYFYVYLEDTYCWDYYSKSNSGEFNSHFTDNAGFSYVSEMGGLGEGYDYVALDRSNSMFWGYGIKMLDEESIELDGKTFYRVDMNPEMIDDAQKISQLIVISENEDVWKISDTPLAEGTEESMLQICRYAITDLDFDGWLEVIKTGYVGNGHNSYSVIYEVQEDMTIKEIDSSILSHFTDKKPFSPDLYQYDSLKAYYDHEGARAVWHYLVDGSMIYDFYGGSYDYSILTFNHDEISLDDYYSYECFEDENGKSKFVYYDENQKEIDKDKYDELKSEYEGFAQKEVGIGWVSETSLNDLYDSYQKWGVLEE